MVTEAGTPQGPGQTNTVSCLQRPIIDPGVKKVEGLKVKGGEREACTGLDMGRTDKGSNRGAQRGNRGGGGSGDVVVYIRRGLHTAGASGTKAAGAAHHPDAHIKKYCSAAATDLLLFSRLYLSPQTLPWWDMG